MVTVTRSGLTGWQLRRRNGNIMYRKIESLWAEWWIFEVRWSVVIEMCRVILFICSYIAIPYPLHCFNPCARFTGMYWCLLSIALLAPESDQRGIKYPGDECKHNNIELNAYLWLQMVLPTTRRPKGWEGGGVGWEAEGLHRVTLRDYHCGFWMGRIKNIDRKGWK